MKTRNIVPIALMALLLCSCIPSVNPFYTAKDVVFEAGLAGEWRAKDTEEQSEVWKFEKGENNFYQLTVTDKSGRQGKFSARLFKLKNHRFLDLMPTECNYAPAQADLVAFAMFPGHLLVRVPQMEPGLKLAFFDFDWLEKHLKANPKALKHRREENSIVLTADTADLQKFVLKNLADLFGDPGELVRQTNRVSTAPGAP